jgi:hypothetical protein
MPSKRLKPTRSDMRLRNVDEDILSPLYSPFPRDIRQRLTTPYERRLIRRSHEQYHRRAADPLGWAQSKTAACDGALPWFNNPACDVSFRPKQKPENGDPQFVTGIYIAGFDQMDSYCDSEIIIICLSRPSCDESDAENRAEAMRNNMREHRYLGVLIGKLATQWTGFSNTRAPFFPCSMPDDQAAWVMDWFKPVLMWPTKSSSGSVDWMVKLQKRDLDKQSWWARPEDVPPPHKERNFNTKTKTLAYSKCGRKNPVITQNDFVCLNKLCEN